jgi:hypothetical protein
MPKCCEVKVSKRSQLEEATEALLLAYARNDDGQGSIKWDDLDAAFILAKLALPGRYEKLVAQLEKA